MHGEAGDILVFAYLFGIFLLFQHVVWKCCRDAKHRPRVIEVMVFTALFGLSLGVCRAGSALFPAALLLGALLPSAAITLYVPKSWDEPALAVYSVALVLAALVLVMT
jgi:hypothetical protein